MEYPELEGPHKDYPCPGSNELKSVLPEALGVFHQNSTQCWSAPREDKVQMLNGHLKLCYMEADERNRLQGQQHSKAA